MRDDSLDDVIASMYASMCFEEGEQPDWDAHARLFAPNARLVRVNDAGVFEFDPRTFCADLERMIEAGVVRSFWEGEISRETRLFGEVAHVLSHYEIRQTRNGERLDLAVKSIQLFCQDGRWRISAMLWRRPAPPPQDLPSS